jgi:hypothetical protein
MTNQASFPVLFRGYIHLRPLPRLTADFGRMNKPEWLKKRMAVSLDAPTCRLVIMSPIPLTAPKLGEGVKPRSSHLVSNADVLEQ